MTAPLVLTLELDPATQQRLDDERRAHFPAGRTQVGAHVTLFHALPGGLRAEVEAELATLSALAAPAVRVTRVRSLGRGVAYDLECPEVEQLHRTWQQRWSAHLTRQDAQRLRLHATVQNKVEAPEARRTLARLQAGFAPWSCPATGVALWRYDGGPWTSLGESRFAPPEAGAT